jgi:hypothetical protein
MHRRRSIFYAACQVEDSEFIQPTGLFKDKAMMERIDDTEQAEHDDLDCDASFPRESEVGETFSLPESLLSRVISFLTESEMLRLAAPVCTAWADAAALAHANLMFASIGSCEDSNTDLDDILDIDEYNEGVKDGPANSIAAAMERDWTFLNRLFPWGRYLSDGGMKKVYKVYNSAAGAVEAVSVT